MGWIESTAFFRLWVNFARITRRIFRIPIAAAIPSRVNFTWITCWIIRIISTALLTSWINFTWITTRMRAVLFAAFF